MSNLPSEPEFEQAYSEVAATLEPLFKKHPEYRRALEIIAIPERIIQFRVVWETDKGEVKVNRGFRVQFNSALGPYKGGLRLHPTVNLSVLKFLGFEQIFKNALTGLNMGGGKGGSDWDPKGKSESETRRFIQSFTTELSRHIGSETDVPAGDIGFSAREGGYFFGQYKRLINKWHGVITGKGLDWGGSHIRPEATGYGTCYYVDHMIKHNEGAEAGFKGKKVVISGSGQVAQFAALKIMELGGTVLSLSDSKGVLISTDAAGYQKEWIKEVFDIKVNKKELSTLGDKGGKLKFVEGARPWKTVESYDVALPCATQNEVDESDAKAMIEKGCRYVGEGANMPCELAAIKLFEQSRIEKKQAGCYYGPGKAANAGGVAISGVEMSQNAQRLTWTPEEVDQKLKDVMKEAFEACLKDGAEFPADGDSAAKEVPSLVVGANVSGFRKVADAMKAHGDWW